MTAVLFRSHFLSAFLVALALATIAMGQSTQPAVFVLNNVSDEISSFTMNADGTLNFIGNFASSDGPQSASLSPNGRFLAVGHGTISETTEFLRIFEVQPDASLMPLLLTSVPDSPLDMDWLTDEVLAVTETSTNSTNFARNYHFDVKANTLTEVDSVITGSFNAYLALHPALPIFYASDSLGSNVLRWFTHDANGNLASAGSLSTGGTYPIRPTLTHDGSFLYCGGGISSGGHAIIGFSVDDEGDLAPLPGSPFTSAGQSPAYFAVSSDNAFLLAGHGTDATVRTFAIDKNGSLTATGFVFDVGLQGTIGDIDVLRNYALITDESTAIDGIRGIYSFAINPDGSLTQVAPIYDVGGVRPEAIIIWDPQSTIPGDLDDDGDVDFDDFAQLLASWGDPGCGGQSPCPADIDGDGDVDFDDFTTLLANWS